MPREGVKHRRICERAVEVLRQIGFSEGDIHISHQQKDSQSPMSGVVQLHRLKSPSGRRSSTNRIKIPDVTAKRNGVTIFIEVETDDSPSIIAGDLHCIDLSNTVHFARGKERERVQKCLATVVVDDPKEKSRKKKQFDLLRSALSFCGAVEDFEICTKSDMHTRIESLLRRNGIIDERGEWVSERIDDSELPRIEAVENILDLQFFDRELLLRALTRPAFAKELDDQNEVCRHQAALATLGDAILRAALTETLFKEGHEKGRITKKRIAKEKNKYLAKNKLTARIVPHTRMSPDEKRREVMKGERARATALEAAIGAVYLEAGLARAKGLVRKWFPD